MTTINNSLSYKELIKSDVKNRNIEYLVHFTPISNLPSILSNGIQSLDFLNANNIPYIYNDSERIEGYKNSISLSITFPNYSMLSKYRIYEQPTKDMALIFLDPSILWTLNCAFFYTNAAKKVFKNTFLSQYKSFAAWQHMFGLTIGKINRNLLNLTPEFTTDPQAEVLCFDSISPKLIKAILFDSQLSFNKISQRLPDIENLYFIEPPYYYFLPRYDHFLRKSLF
jgi:hypothetical protein